MAAPNKNQEQVHNKDTVASIAPLSPGSDPATRVLKKGDLVRVAERREPGVKCRDGGLGRIHRSIPTDNDSNGHPFSYDVDFVLGGRISRVERSYLVYTTADAEGMTERRKRNPSTAVKEMEETKQVKKKAAPKKKKAGGKKASKTVKKGKPAAGSKHKGKNGKKATGKKKATAKGQKAQKAETKKKDEEALVVRDLYEPHKRDFEKCLARLEKQDTYAFFQGDVPPENDEHYGTVVDDAQVTSAQAPATPTKKSAPVFPDAPPYNFVIIRKRMEHGRYVLDRVRQHRERTFSPSRTAPALLHPKGVHWEQFRDDVVQMCDAAIARDPDGVSGGRGTLGRAAEKVKNVVLKLYEQNGRRQMKEMEDDEARHKFYSVVKSAQNHEAAMQGKWRRTAFPERKYERLSSDVVCAGLSALDERTAVYELQTSLPESFVGLSYTYTDTGESEGWMKSVLDDTKGNDSAAEERKAALDLANDDGVVRAQVQATMTSILIGVQDRVMTDTGVLKEDELKSANWAGDVEDVQGASSNESIDTMSADSPDIVEQPVWGIDCYTRRNITSCIEKDFDSAIALEFIEKWLLPAINACPVALAHNMINAARILEGLSLPRSTELEQEHADDSGDERWSHSLLGKALKDKMSKVGPPWLKSVAHQLRLAISTLGHDFFRVHPKGHGAIVLQPKLKANTLVTFYRGEVYPSWRWGEKMDAIELTQNRLELRPNLPDFYNMALERPQVDPRGYGLLFVDASRKAGHGSSLSHSCEPTCEVRVAAVDGQLCLAMTTIRELELGEEVTFDYNAVTESLNEYRSAVCLCGHGRCRGSFLHFATADCYQEVLNRNLPIAVRFANIIKGCAKQVMSEVDEKLLATHGFGTAAFGAVSFERTTMSDSDSHRQKLDSIENVPIWLRTYVADMIRYIEYERRALPVMLLCNHLKRTEGHANETSSQKSTQRGRGGDKTMDSRPTKKQKKPSKDESRPIPGSRPEPVFLFFSRKQSAFFRSQLSSHGLTDLKGIEMQRAMLKVASSCWKALSDDMKQHWKDEAVLEWKKNGGEEKARLEAERQKTVKANTKKRKPVAASSDEKSRGRKKRKSDLKNADAIVHPSRMSFEAADAEGVSAMEQRIQQLTQTLSRVGRVLDRHRESSVRTIASQNELPDSATESIHSPLASLSDDDVVHWLWHHENGPVRLLLRACSSEKCVSPALLSALKATESKYSAVLNQEAPLQSSGIRPTHLSPRDARTKVTEALLEFRNLLCNGLLSMEGEMRQHNLERSRVKAKIRRDAQKKKKHDAEKGVSLPMSEVSSARQTVSSVLDWMVDTVVEKAEKSTGSNETEQEDEFHLKPWLKHYADRWKLDAAADLLLMYAHTSNFFAMKPYTPLESTPIEVYARELGNAVPRSVVETAQGKTSRASDDVVLFGSKTEKSEAASAETGIEDAETIESHAASGETEDGTVSEKKSSRSRSRVLCQPDDIITNVTIAYRGDYVLSQLLQWYNGGIGQKPGLPDVAGCVVLPSLSAPWRGKLGGKSVKNKPTRYASEGRPMLLDWLQDSRKRGSPFEGLLSEVFPEYSPEQTWNDTRFPCSPVGSPILDFLVTGDDSSIRNIATALSENIRSTGEKSGSAEDGKSGSATDRLQSTVDEGMPAQAVSHWVQCEHPDCLKWRKVPWHVDVDALPEKFYCSDNKWNPTASSCEAPEDEWDEYDAQLKNEGIAKASDAGMVVEEPGTGPVGRKPTSGGTVDAKEFVIGARFDVLRNGKTYYSPGEVVNVDFSGPVKRVLFHFPKTKAIHDEWIEIESPRIAPLGTKDTGGRSKNSKKKAGKKIAVEAMQTKAGAASPKASLQQKQRALIKQTPLAVIQQTPLAVVRQAPRVGDNDFVRMDPKSALSRESVFVNNHGIPNEPSFSREEPRPAYGYVAHATTVYSDGRLSMQLSDTSRPSPARRHLATSAYQYSPVISQGVIEQTSHMGHNGLVGMDPMFTASRGSVFTNDRGVRNEPSFLREEARPAHVAHSTTVHNDGRLSMQLSPTTQSSPSRHLVASAFQSSPVMSSRGDLSVRIPKKVRAEATVASVPSASYTIPRKPSPQGGNVSSDARIPRKLVPPESAGLMDGASLLLGISTPARTASDMSRSALSDHMYQARTTQGQIPLPLPNEYFDSRNYQYRYWQEQQQGPQYGYSPSKKQYDDRR